MVVKTASDFDARWAAEADDAFQSDTLVATRSFGNDARLTGIKIGNSSVPQGQLGKRTFDSFAFGKAVLGAQFEATLSAFWWLQLIWPDHSVTGAGPYTHTFAKRNLPKSFLCHLYHAGTSGNVNLKMQGCVIGTATIRANMDDVVKVAYDIMSGKGTLATTQLMVGGNSVDKFAAATNEETNNYTFVHASLDVPDGTDVADVQSVEISINTGQEQRHVLGTANARSVLGKRLEYTGTFVTSVEDYAYFNRVVARAEVATLSVVFDNGLTGMAQRRIKFTFTGISINDAEISASEVEPVEYTVPWQARECTATVISGVATLQS